MKKLILTLCLAATGTFAAVAQMRLTLDQALERAGARDGDEIRILGYAFEFESALMHEEDIYEGLDI